MKNDNKHPRNPRLREARLSRGLRQEQLAELIGTSSVNISRWENGSHSPSLYYRQRLAESLGKTPAELGLLAPPDSRIWNIPYAYNPLFTGREQLLATLHDRLATARTSVLTRPQALYGLGGIGKTAAAVEYAWRYGDDYTFAFWLSAATRETFIDDFVKLADRLDLPERGQQNQSQVIAAIQHWLATHDGWLLILDNADDLRLALDFLPPGHKGSLLFTTRAQAVGTIADGIEVEKLSDQESALLLLRRGRLLTVDTPLTQAQAEDRTDAERIVREMDGLPLAIVQAGAYIEESHCTLADYLSLYTTHRKDLLGQHSDLLIDYPETVATTWSLSFQQVGKQNPAAADLLRFCAFLAPDAISEELLSRGADNLGDVLGAAVRDPFKLNEALKVLLRYSLVRRNAHAHVLTVHRLVQTALREDMDRAAQSLWAVRTVRTINAAFSEDSYHTSAKHWMYIPHVQECAVHIEQYQLHIPEAAQLLYRAADFLYFHGLYTPSQTLHRQALAIREQAGGLEHPSVAESLNALAVLARLQRDHKSAEQLHKRALAIRERTSGPEHPLTGLSLNNLGVLYREQGRYEQAEQLLQRALGIRKQSLGPEHRDTLATVLNLAKLQIEQRQYEPAEQLLKQALTTCERSLESDPSVIAHTLGLLAKLSSEQGAYEQAEHFLQRSLAIRQNMHGPEHPATAERFNDLAELASERGQFVRALALCKQAVDICEKTLGDDHPDTLAYRENLARIMSKREAEQNA